MLSYAVLRVDDTQHDVLMDYYLVDGNEPSGR